MSDPLIVEAQLAARDKEIKRLTGQVACRDGLVKGAQNALVKAADEIERLTTEVSGLREALTIYADRQGWTSFVPDSYRGECWEFDWNGDLGDKPWEMAVNGLNAASSSQKSTN